MMRNFIMQQQRIDMQWKESMEKRAVERELFEQEWRQKMEKLERERLMMEQAWREREEQRRLREESRAQKRDALLTMLLNKLIHPLLAAVTLYWYPSVNKIFLVFVMGQCPTLTTDTWVDGTGYHVMLELLH
ncbi:UNVERIFIED_CONTAM: hypothetical protein Scaly_0882400 [Sesamum calycinum]|uniref:Uncharacterized protein n=1 Tax=Sesamum calycinum TaxID=2727403 RepID=A0AAW2QX86_9LAMI